MPDVDHDQHVHFTFDASHHAFWAEDLAVENSIPAELVPAPSRSEARCGLALRAPVPRAAELESLFDTEGIGFTRWDESSS
ncbi:MAG: DUF3343 domain-containing protein [Gemmatimonadota bacterium]